MYDVNNGMRALWAREALKTFQRVCRTDDCDAIPDLICDLLHLCDMNPEKYGNAADAIRRGAANYEFEREEENSNEI